MMDRLIRRGSRIIVYPSGVPPTQILGQCVYVAPVRCAGAGIGVRFPQEAERSSRGSVLEPQMAPKLQKNAIMSRFSFLFLPEKRLCVSYSNYHGIFNILLLHRVSKITFWVPPAWKNTSLGTSPISHRFFLHFFQKCGQNGTGWRGK